MQNQNLYEEIHVLMIYLTIFKLRINWSKPKLVVSMFKITLRYNLKYRVAGKRYSISASLITFTSDFCISYFHGVTNRGAPDISEKSNKIIDIHALTNYILPGKVP